MQNFILSDRFLDTLPNPMVFSRNGTIEYCNPPAKKLLQDVGIRTEGALPAVLADKTEEQATQVDIGGQLWSLTVHRQEEEALYLLTPMADLRQETMAQISHQLRIRLSHLTLASEGLQADLGAFLQHQHRKWIAREELYLNRLQRLTEDMEFASLSDAELAMLYPSSEVNLEQICNETEPLLSGLGETIGRCFTFRCAIGEYPIKANPILLRKLIFQLAANAYAAKGDLNLLLKRQGSSALLYFSDNGNGIPPEQMSNLFSSELLPNAHDTKSLGLGLFICRRIALLYGGTLTLLPQPNGTKLILSLPLLKKASASGSFASSANALEATRVQALTELSELLPYSVFEKKYGE